jgi:hypothetical protein
VDSAENVKALKEESAANIKALKEESAANVNALQEKFSDYLAVVPDRFMQNLNYFTVQFLDDDDLTYPEYMNHVVAEIRKATSLLDVGAIPATTPGASHPTTVSNGSASTRLLESLTVTEVETLFDALNLGTYKSIVAANALDGVTLSYCATIEDVVSVGITVRPKAAVLLAKVTEFKAAGVPLTLLTPTAPTPSGPPNPEALIQASQNGNMKAIRTCLNNRADIESKDTVCTLCPLSTYIVSSSLYSNSLLYVTIVIECWFL